MDDDARSACLRAVNLVARSARLCAAVETTSSQYRTSVDSAERVIDRAESYYNQARAGHASTERAVRLLSAAIVCARAIVSALHSSIEPEPEDLVRMAEKLERAIIRADPAAAPPVA